MNEEKSLGQRHLDAQSLLRRVGEEAVQSVRETIKEYADTLERCLKKTLDGPYHIDITISVPWAASGSRSGLFTETRSYQPEEVKPNEPT